MSPTAKKFVVAKRNVVTPQEILVEKKDVGIVMSEERGLTTVFFVRIWKEVQIGKDDIKVIRDVKKTGDGYTNKICNVCHKLKETIEFDKNQNAKNNRTVRRPSCRKCRMDMDGRGISSAKKKEWNKK